MLAFLLMVMTGLVTGFIAYARGKVAGRRERDNAAQGISSALGMPSLPNLSQDSWHDGYLQGHRTGWFQAMGEMGVALASDPLVTPETRVPTNISDASLTREAPFSEHPAPAEDAVEISATLLGPVDASARPSGNATGFDSPSPPEARPISHTPGLSQGLAPALPKLSPAGEPRRPDHAPKPVAPSLSPAQLRARRESWVINITLYVASLLIVAAGTLFLIGDAPAALKLGGVLLVTLLFLLAGHLLHARVPKVRPAAIAFVGTGLALVPLCGVALDVLVLHQPRLSWLLTSVFGVVIFVHAALRLKSQPLGYLALTFILSTVVSGIQVVGAGLVWTFVALLVLSVLLNLAARYAPGHWRAPLMGPLRVLDPWLAPVTVVAALFFVPQFSYRDLCVILGSLFVYCVARSCWGRGVWRRVSYVVARLSAAAFLCYLALLFGLHAEQIPEFLSVLLGIQLMALVLARGRLGSFTGWSQRADAGWSMTLLVALMVGTGTFRWVGELYHGYSGGVWEPGYTSYEMFWAWAVVLVTLVAALYAAWVWRPQAELFAVAPLAVALCFPAIALQGFVVAGVLVAAFLLVYAGITGGERATVSARGRLLTGAEVLGVVIVPLAIQEFLPNTAARSVVVQLSGLAMLLGLSALHLVALTPWRRTLIERIFAGCVALLTLLSLGPSIQAAQRFRPGLGLWVGAIAAAVVVGAGLLMVLRERRPVKAGNSASQGNGAAQRLGVGSSRTTWNDTLSWSVSAWSLSAVWVAAIFETFAVSAIDLAWGRPGMWQAQWLMAGAGAICLCITATLAKGDAGRPLFYASRVLGTISVIQLVYGLHLGHIGHGLNGVPGSPTILALALAAQAVIPPLTLLRAARASKLSTGKSPYSTASVHFAVADLTILALIGTVATIVQYSSFVSQGAPLNWQWTLTALVALGLAGALVIARPDGLVGPIVYGGVAASILVTLLVGWHSPIGYGFTVLSGASLLCLLAAVVTSRNPLRRQRYAIAVRAAGFSYASSLLLLLHVGIGTAALVLLAVIWAMHVTTGFPAWHVVSVRLDRWLRAMLLGFDVLVLGVYVLNPGLDLQRWIALVAILSVVAAAFLQTRITRNHWFLAAAVLALLTLAPVLGPAFFSAGPFLADPVLGRSAEVAVPVILAIGALTPVAIGRPHAFTGRFESVGRQRQQEQQGQQEQRQTQSSSQLFRLGQRLQSRLFWFCSAGAFFLEALVLSLGTGGKTVPVFAVLLVIALALFWLSHTERLPILYAGAAPVLLVAGYGLALSFHNDGGVLSTLSTSQTWMLASAVLAAVGYAALWSWRVLRETPARRFSLLGMSALALLGGTLFSLSSHTYAWFTVLFLLAGLVMLLPELPKARRSLALQLGAGVLVLAIQRAVIWGESASLPKLFWMLQWYVLFLGVLVLWNWMRKNVRAAFNLACAMAALITFSALLTLISASAAQQFWVLLSFVALVVAGLLSQRQLLSWWGAAGVLLAVIYMLRSYVYLWLGLLAVVLIAVVLFLLLRKRPPA